MDIEFHEFFRKDYDEVANKNYQLIKKNFENFIDAEAQDIENISDYSSDYEDEEIFTTKGTVKLLVEGQELELPAEILQIEDVKDLINFEQYNRIFTEEEKKHLATFLPETKDGDKNKIVKSLLSGEKFFMSNPLQSFLEKAKAGVYTKTFQLEREIEDRLSLDALKTYYSRLAHDLARGPNDNSKKKQIIQSLLTKRNAAIDLEELSLDESEHSIESFSQISLEKHLSEISDGETQYASAGEEIQKVDMVDLDEELMENRKLEAQKALALESLKNKKQDKDLSDLPTPSLSQQSKVQKVTKSTVTMKANPKEWVEQFRQQERDRYANPTKPWNYICFDGTKAIVAPVAKKISTAQNSKPREHFLLKADRPSYITILCLVRDAAARLPGGVGTRADICELLKESQYINENTPDDKLSNIVSGALDRLHYEDDPCVKYDSEKKVWIYLHKERMEEYGPWLDPSDSRSSKKKEYNLKYKSKKKTTKGDEKSSLKPDGND